MTVVRDNLIEQMVYRTALCCIAAFGTLLTFRFFYTVYEDVELWDFIRRADDLNLNFLKYYTNLSNWFAFAVSVIVLKDNVKRVKAGERRGHNKAVPVLKFMTTVMILVTFVVYSTMLESPFTLRYWRNIYSLTCHIFVPVLFVLDFFLYDEHRTVKVYYPLLSMIIPLIYAICILIAGACIPDFKYPYFCLDVNRFGYGGVALWMLAFIAGFAVLGYLLWLYDKRVKVGGKWKHDFSRIDKKKEETES